MHVNSKYILALVLHDNLSHYFKRYQCGGNLLRLRGNVNASLYVSHKFHHLLVCKHKLYAPASHSETGFDTWRGTVTAV